MADINVSLFKDLAMVGDLVRAPTGDIATIQGLANYKNALFHRLITTPGSLVHRPGYGVGILEWQNSLSSFANQQALAQKITDQFMQDPRTESVTGVSIVTNDSDPRQTVVAVRVVPKGYTEQAMKFTPFIEGL